LGSPLLDYLVRSRLLSQIKKLLAEHLDPTACAVIEALFFTPLRSVQRALLCTLEVPPLGFGYPFDGFKLSKTSEVSFSSQRSWAFPYEALFQPGIGHPVSRIPSALALS
jgi:hypothetical protein